MKAMPYTSAPDRIADYFQITSAEEILEFEIL